MKALKNLGDFGRNLCIVTFCFTLAFVSAFLGSTEKVKAQPAQGYWTPTTVWGTGIGGTTNAMTGNTTNITRINNLVNRTGDFNIQIIASDMTAAAATNCELQLGRSLIPITPTNATGGVVAGNYAGIELFAQIPFTLNGTTPTTVCTNFGADNTSFGGCNPTYYYIMWCSNGLTANPLTNMTVTVFVP